MPPHGMHGGERERAHTRCVAFAGDAVLQTCWRNRRSFATRRTAFGHALTPALLL